MIFCSNGKTLIWLRYYTLLGSGFRYHKTIWPSSNMATRQVVDSHYGTIIRKMALTVTVIGFMCCFALWIWILTSAKARDN